MSIADLAADNILGLLFSPVTASRYIKANESVQREACQNSSTSGGGRRTFSCENGATLKMAQQLPAATGMFPMVAGTEGRPGVLVGVAPVVLTAVEACNRQT